jgi:hypothetical protein
MKNTRHRSKPQSKKSDHAISDRQSRDALGAQRRRIRKIFSRILQADEVHFLLSVWKAGNVRAVDCPKFAVGLLQRGWIERDDRTVRLSHETRLLLAENVE